jgi:hypothetical protein
MNDDDETTTETPTLPSIEIARWYAQMWAVETALNPQPRDEEDDDEA